MSNISSLANHLNKKNINDLQKETLLDLINLYDSLNKEKFITRLICDLIKLEKNELNFEDTKLLILNYRINAIFLSLNKKIHLKKELKTNYSIYEYEGFWLIFIKTWDQAILNDLNEIQKDDKRINWKTTGKFISVRFEELEKKLKTKNNVILKILK